MPRDAKHVHLQPEEYKIGWTHGFYDARSDDGAYYGNLDGTGHARGGYPDAENARLYYHGYLDGIAARICGEQRRSTPSAVAGRQLIPLNPEPLGDLTSRREEVRSPDSCLTPSEDNEFAPAIMPS